MSNLRMPQPGEAWRHYKGGFQSLYEIIGVGRDTETGQPVVIYKPYGWASWQPPELYSRPLGVFLASVAAADGRNVQRFTFDRPAESVSDEHRNGEDREAG